MGKLENKTEDVGYVVYRCGICETDLDPDDVYCSHCGVKLKF